MTKKKKLQEIVITILAAVIGYGVAIYTLGISLYMLDNSNVVIMIKGNILDRKIAVLVGIILFLLYSNLFKLTTNVIVFRLKAIQRINIYER